MPSRTILRRRIERGTEDWAAFAKFVDPPSEPGRTLDRVRPDVTLRVKVGAKYDMPLPFRLPNGDRKLRMWVIAHDGKAATFPSSAIRVRAGQNVLVTASTSTGPHTIHWHGIEGTPLNDGVGKHSFEIRGDYGYQFTPREAGFYFYHCHRNTPLHFEMGLYGALIIDPPEGPGYVRAYSPETGHVVRYDTEVVWVCAAHDHRWRAFEHDHGLHLPDVDGELDPNNPDSFPQAAGLGDWNPSVFTITGAVARNGSTVITDPRAMGRTNVGKTVLVRLLNSSYAVQEYRLGADALVIAQDGRAFGVPPFGSYSQPFWIPAGTPFRLTSAMRHDMLIKPTSPGTIPLQVDYWDWGSGALLGRARTQIVVT